jgi:hypothetical protein
MSKETVEQKEKSEEKKPDCKDEAQSSCSCGCIPPKKTK